VKAVIIYDDFACAARAKANLKRVAQLAGEPTQNILELCLLELLNQTAFATQMMGEAADAHLIVITLSQPESLPARLLDWLEGWAVFRQIQDAALAVFVGERSDALSMPVLHELSQFTERHGLDLIFDSPTPMLPDFPDERTRESYRHWGINE